MNDLLQRTLELVHDFEELGGCPACGKRLVPDPNDETRAIGHGQGCFIPLARASVFLSDREKIEYREPRP